MAQPCVPSSDVPVGVPPPSRSDAKDAEHSHACADNPEPRVLTEPVLPLVASLTALAANLLSARNTPTLDIDDFVGILDAYQREHSPLHLTRVEMAMLFKLFTAPHQRDESRLLKMSQAEFASAIRWIGPADGRGLLSSSNAS